VPNRAWPIRVAAARPDTTKSPGNCRPTRKDRANNRRHPGPDDLTGDARDPEPGVADQVAPARPATTRSPGNCRLTRVDRAILRATPARTTSTTLMAACPDTVRAIDDSSRSRASTSRTRGTPARAKSVVARATA